MASTAPSYLALHESGELRRRAEAAHALLRDCTVCPHLCHVNRLAGETGRCNTGAQARVYSAHAHFGEEPPLVGSYGSGTIFISWCNLRCVFCQNAELSAYGVGRDLPSQAIAELMLDLQTQRCHNINFVSPTHVVPQILEALVIAVEHGLRLPLVYNTGGYDRIETLQLLDGVFDIYMPDMKYDDPETAEHLSDIPNYPEINRAAVREMHRQVGDLELDARGVAIRGLLVRHLVLPQRLAGAQSIMRFLAEEISPDTYVNVMDQYRPCHYAHQFPPLDRRLTPAEYRDALETARTAGLHRFAR
ncbi:MAG: radical SAM protein [Candidatus Hydrogenedentes bacterium]|nr:radical SAM protein [Candidatus Hydrogenedentota bacterium]